MNLKIHENLAELRVDAFHSEECRLTGIQGKSHVSARQYEKFAEATLAVTSVDRRIN